VVRSVSTKPDYFDVWLANDKTHLKDMSEVLAAGGEDDLMGPDAPPLTGQRDVHQLLLALQHSGGSVHAGQNILVQIHCGKHHRKPFRPSENYIFITNILATHNCI
jgi:hypothetical protein